MSQPTIEPVTPKTGAASGVVLFPGPLSEWEVWENAGTDRARLRSTGLAQLPPGTQIAAAGLPVGSVLNFVFHAPPADASSLRALASFQREQRALATEKGQPPVFDAVPAGPEDAQKQRLVMVEELSGNIPPELGRPEISRFETSARMLPLPPDGCALWLENSRLVIGVMRGGELVYFQSLADARLTPAVLDELRGLGRILKMEGLMTEAPVIWVWADAGGGAEAALGPLFGGKVVVSARPAPRLPARVGQLVPSSVVQARLQRSSRARRRRLVGVVAALYLVVISTWAGVLLSRKLGIERLQAELDGNRAKVESLQKAATAWKQTQPTVDPSNYPLMILLEIRRAMPEKDLWLTEFRIANGVVDLRGTTTEVDLVYQFRQKLNVGAQDGGIDWAFDTPSIQADNLTQFRVQGKLPYASAQ